MSLSLFRRALSDAMRDALEAEAADVPRPASRSRLPAPSVRPGARRVGRGRLTLCGGLDVEAQTP